jgi:ligand-binding SRPBCC domain-containing protein
MLRRICASSSWVTPCGSSWENQLRNRAEEWALEEDQRVDSEYREVDRRCVEREAAEAGACAGAPLGESEMSVYARSFKVGAPLSEVAAFHDDPVSLVAIAPSPARVGSCVIFQLGVGPFGVTWNGVVAEYVEQKYFRDVPNSGPFGAWSHTHAFAAEANGTRVIDRVEYEPPFGLRGKLLDPILVKPSLAFMFNYRARKTRELLHIARKPNWLRNRIDR